MKRLSISTVESVITLPGDKMGCFSHVASKPDRMLFQRRREHGSAEINHRAILQTAMKIQIIGQQIILKALTENGRFLQQWIIAQSPEGWAWNNVGDGIYRCDYVKQQQPIDEEERLTCESAVDIIRRLIFNADCHRPWHCGLLFSYDLIDLTESLPSAKGDKKIADVEMLCPEILLEWDGRSIDAVLTGFIFDKDQRKVIEKRIKNFAPEVCRELSPSGNSAVSVDCSDEDFINKINNAKRYLYSGDVFQLVLSRSFLLPCHRPWAAYQYLLDQNPAPYHFYWNSSDWKLFGASPETSVLVNERARQVSLYPIAGTRPRGFTESGFINPDLDERLEAELRMDAKELSEHSMLVDLARNDLARICLPGGRQVKQFMKVEKYSRVMHLVSEVKGHLRPELDALHAYQACLNMGTLVGSPKVRAMALLRNLEADYRGAYGGAIGMIDQYGNLDTSIVIRSAFVTNGQARIQAGAGIVLESDPHAEMQETRFKAQAVVNAIIHSNQSSDKDVYEYSVAG
ncbi:MAG: anthranilate synthase component 1 [Cellvibrio sp.]